MEVQTKVVPFGGGCEASHKLIRCGDLAEVRVLHVVNRHGGRSETFVFGFKVEQIRSGTDDIGHNQMPDAELRSKNGALIPFAIYDSGNDAPNRDWI